MKKTSSKKMKKLSKIFTKMMLRCTYFKDLQICQNCVEGIWRSFKGLQKVDIPNPNNAFTLNNCEDVKMMLKDY